MKKIILSFFSLILFFILAIFIFLSTRGYETDKFNDFISKEIEKKESNLNVNLKKIKVKINLKNISLFLSTKSPEITLQNIELPISELSVYLDFLSIFKQNLQIKRVVIFTDELDISDFKKVVTRIKPSNFKSFILNNIEKGKLKNNFDLTFGENFELTSYKIKGYLKKTDILLAKNIKIKNTNFNFIADNEIILINSISANLQGIPITNGNVEINKKDDYIINGSLNSIVKLNEKNIKKIIPKLEDSDFFNNKIEFSLNSLNKFNLVFSNSLKLKEYNYNLNGNLENAQIHFRNVLKSSLLKNDISILNFKKTDIKFSLNKKKENILELDGKYKFNDSEKFENFKVKNEFRGEESNFNINLNLREDFLIDLINYKKGNDKIAKIKADITFAKNEININEIEYKEEKNLINIKKIKLNKKYQIKNFKKISVKTFINEVENNNFEIISGKKIIIKGLKFDSTNLIKNINSENKNSLIHKINQEIEIDFKNIATKLAIPLNNFRLIGEIKKGKFVKIVSKSEFSDNEFLDISLKKLPNNNKKILEIYSDLAKPILADFIFFKGLEGGQLLFTSKFDEENSSSNLQIKNFKVMNAPAFAKLLALADLSGLVVLLSGEGLNFESLEIKYTNNKKVLTINEIYASGPSITILMEGYIENDTGLTSLRGTMVPAKEINKLISKIPVLGDILIGKEIGEGVFGVSFKMKGPRGKIKTTVNPIKTLTPRFITRALEKQKKQNKK